MGVGAPGARAEQGRECGLEHVAERAGACCAEQETQKCGLLQRSCWLVTWPGRERTSSAVLERSTATWLGIQLDSSLLVLVAEVSPLLALRPRPIVRCVVVRVLCARPVKAR